MTRFPRAGRGSERLPGTRHVGSSRKSRIRSAQRAPEHDGDPTRGRFRRLVLEALEDRCVLAAGDLDPTFGVGGIVRTELFSNLAGDRSAQDVAIQSDGKMVVVGSELGVVRYLANGQIDGSFGFGGAVAFDGTATAVAIQTDGKIVVAGGHVSGPGDEDYVVARYNTDGSLDTSFSGDGKQTTDFAGSNDIIRDLVIQGDKILVAGHSIMSGGEYDFSLARYIGSGALSGELDSSFDEDGKRTDSLSSSSDHIYGIALQLDKIVVAGDAFRGSNYDFALARYDENGNFISSFVDGDNGTIREIGRDVAVQGADNKIVVVGSKGENATENFEVRRYKSDLTDRDTTFSVADVSVGRSDFAWKIAIQSDGKIVAAGNSDSGTNYDMAVVRYNANGTLDDSGPAAFDTDGKATVDLRGTADSTGGVAIQPADGNIVLLGDSENPAGGRDFALLRLRLNPSGSIDTSFGANGRVFTAGRVDDRSSAVAAQADGKLVVVGHTDNGFNTDFAVTRYNANGTLDTSFDGDGKVTFDFGLSRPDQAKGIAIDATNGNIFVVGSSDNGGDDFAIARLNPNNGSVVWKKRTPIGTTADVAYDVAIQGTKIVVVGSTHNGSNDDVALVRYNAADGSFDSGFGTLGIKVLPVGLGMDVAYGVAIQDGKIVIAGASFNVSNNDFLLARFLDNGVLDSSFGVGGIRKEPMGPGDDIAYGLAIQSDGNPSNDKILVAGQSYNGSNYDFALARFDSNGNPDSTFSGDGKLVTLIAQPGMVPRTLTDSAFTSGWTTFPDDVDGVTVAVAPFPPAGGVQRGTMAKPFGTYPHFGAYGNALTHNPSTQGPIDRLSFSFSYKEISEQHVTVYALLKQDDTYYRSQDNFASAFGPANFGSLKSPNLQASDFVYISGPGDATPNFGSTGGQIQFGYVVGAGRGGYDEATWEVDDFQVTVNPGTTDDFAHSVAVQADGKIIASGYYLESNVPMFAVVRYNAYGTLDASFHGDGIATASLGVGSNGSSAYGMAVQPDGKVVVAGHASNGNDFDFALARFETADPPPPGVPQLLADFNLYPAGVAIQSPVVQIGGVACFFSLKVPGSGGTIDQLWRSDGTTAGTRLIKDFSPGRLNFLELINVNDTLFFIADDGTGKGSELWMSDGTFFGTHMVKDIYIGNNNSSNPRRLTNLNGTLFFAANDGVKGYELWQSNGTEETTYMVKDIRPGALESFPDNLVNVDGTLFFSANDGTTGTELWKSDGTAAGTELVKNITVVSLPSTPLWLTNVNGTLFFTASDGVNGRELWRSNGTATGTNMVKDIRPGSSSSPSLLTNVNGALFFAADDGTHGLELWMSNGTATGTELVKDIRPDASVDLNNLTSLTSLGNTLFFRVNDGTHGYELWRSDGTSVGTYLLKDINSGSGSGIPISQNLANVNGTLFFAANDGTHGLELWKSNGTAAGTVLVADIRTGPNSSSPSSLNAIGANLFFNTTFTPFGIQAWVLDARPAAIISAPFVVPEGKSITLDGTGSYAVGGVITAYEWDFDGDSQFDDATGHSPTFSAAALDGPSSVVVRLRVTDSGGLTSTDTAVVTINNVDPEIVSLTLSSTSINENDSVSLTGAITDDGTLDTHTVVISWGPGEGTTTINLGVGELTFSASHPYPDDNPTNTDSDTYPVSITVSDDDGGSDSTTTSVTVKNVAPSNLSLNLTANTINENGSTTLSGSFSDPGTLDTHTVVINWGGPVGQPEGTTTLNLAAGVTTFSTTHQFLDDNPTGTASDPYVINVTVTDDDGGSASASTSVTVTNIAPVVDAGADQTTTQATVSIDPAHPARFTDVGIHDTHTATIEWGDGTGLATGNIVESNGAGTVTGSHTYVRGGTYTVRVCVTDDDLATTCDARQVTFLKDFTRPFSAVQPLASNATSLSIPILVTSGDPQGPEGPASGVKEYDVFVAVDSGPLIEVATLPASSPSPTFIFNATSNHTYYFRSLARDNAGNQESKPMIPDAFTRVGDLNKPITQVTSANHNSTGLFTINVSGVDVGGSQLARFDLYVVIDGGSPTAIGSPSGGVAGAGGVYLAVGNYQGLTDGATHNYRFYSRSRDSAGNVEDAPASGDVTVNVTFAVPANLTATGIDVQQGARQRSFIRTVDVLFNSQTGLDALRSPGRVAVERFDLLAPHVAAGTGMIVSGFGLIRDGNKLRLDFDSPAGDGFYRLRLDVNGDGDFADAGESFEFYRLLGDANGDAIVDELDWAVVDSLFGRAGSNLDGDLNGDGVVNSADKGFTLRSYRGRKLADALKLLLDD